MQQKTYVYRLLMGLSLGLLVLFQAYWLRSVYREQKELLEADLDNLFTQNIRNLQDSLFRENWIAMRDSMVRRATILIDRPDTPKADDKPVVQVVAVGHDTGSMENRDKKSFPHHVRQREARLERRKRFFINNVNTFKGKASEHGPMLGIFDKKDTLRLETLRNSLQEDMDRASLSFPFALSRHDTVPDIESDPGIVTYHSGGFPPIHLYLVSFSSYEGYLFTRIAPNLLFAFFLLGITSVSFNTIFRSLRQQQKLALLKNDFISNITHELKTPIATVSVALEALQNFQGINNPERTREYLNISQHELQRLSILVDRVLKMSMFENNALQMHTERFDVKKTLEKVMQSMGLQFERAHARVALHVGEGDFFVEGDSVHLTNVVYNLLDNALKYSPSHPEIQISLRQANEQVLLSVQDNGVGIPEEYQKKIFEQFFRVPQEGQQHNTKGYGLGLSYVAEVLRRHSGHIEVSSQPAQGSLFTVTLPKIQPSK